MTIACRNILKSLNGESGSDYYCYANIHMENDGIVNVGKSDNKTLILVNYICANNVATNYSSEFFEVKSGNYKRSDIDVPFLSSLYYNGGKYSLHKQTTKIINGKLSVIYSFACKYPSTFILVGDCSDGKVYNATLHYDFRDNGLQESEVKVGLEI
jgi:hypothetical protein